jgi:Rieske Fe-S protein
LNVVPSDADLHLRSVTSRRRALWILLAGPLALLAACESTVARLRGKRLVQVATLDKLPPGSAYRTTHGVQPLVIVNVDGEVRTFLGVCTHEGCPLGWNPQQHLIRCPCHGSAFDTAGRVVQGPAQVALTRLETIVENGAVFLVEPRVTPLAR